MSAATILSTSDFVFCKKKKKKKKKKGKKPLLLDSR
jgi:hypothetical protein